MQKQENKYGFDEVVDTFSDAIEVATGFEGKLKDGIQFTDSFELVEQYPKMVEMYNDRKIFAQQLADLTPEETDQVVAQIAERTQKDEGFVRKYAIKSLNLAARIYRLGRHVIDEFQDIREELKNFA